jgi:hypothetical protein
MGIRVFDSKNGFQYDESLLILLQFVKQAEGW